ncbi:MAG: insulinase family protein [Myxococcales bacterium]|nr:insulinase family protein [Myxococcales bacterium]
MTPVRTLTHRAATLAAVLALAAAPAVAQPAEKAPPAAKPAAKAKAAAKPAKGKQGLKLPELEQFTLDNGLQVAFMHVDAAPVVSVQVWYHVGSKDEPRNRRGSAHMFEHMMFKGTQHVPPEEHARDINKVGGYVNAGTMEDATFYYETLPADYLDFAVQLEAERMRNLLFRDDMIKTEREVVKEEIRQQENSPLAKGFLRFLEIAYTKHPYSWTAGGTIADLDATTADDLEKFYDTYYQPNNALLVVVGNVTLDQVKATADKHFGAIAKAAAPPRPADAAPEPAQTEQRREVVEAGQIGLTLIGYHIPEAKAVDVYALQLASQILGDGESSRLKQRIKAVDKKTKRPLGLEAGSQVMIKEDPGLMVLLGVYLDPAAADPIEAAILDEVAKLAAKGPSADELRKAKNQMQSGFVFGLDSADGIAQQIGQSWILTGDAGQFLRDLDEIEKVTTDDIKRVAKTYLAPTQATIVVIPPKGAPAAPASK